MALSTARLHALPPPSRQNPACSVLLWSKGAGTLVTGRLESSSPSKRQRQTKEVPECIVMHMHVIRVEI